MFESAIEKGVKELIGTEHHFDGIFCLEFVDIVDRLSVISAGPKKRTGEDLFFDQAVVVGERAGCQKCPVSFVPLQFITSPAYIHYSWTDSLYDEVRKAGLFFRTIEGFQCFVRRAVCQTGTFGRVCGACWRSRRADSTFRRQCRGDGQSMIEMHTVYRRRWRNQFVRLASIIAEASVIAAV